MAMDEERLASAFVALASDSLEMDGWTFAKCMRSAGLVKVAQSQAIESSSATLDSTEIDLIFAKHKERGGRRIKFPAFLAALRAIATKTGLSNHVVAHMVSHAAVSARDVAITDHSTSLIASSGPERLLYEHSKYTGTHRCGEADVRVDCDPQVQTALVQRRSSSLVKRSSSPTKRSCGVAERLFYDKASYTGTHKRGGPTIVGNGLVKEGYSDLSELVNRDNVWQDDFVAPRQRRVGPANASAKDNAMEDAPITSNSTLIWPNRLYYDKSAYTGICKQTSSDFPGHVVDFAELVDRDRRPHQLSNATGRESPKTIHQKMSPQAGRGPERFFYDKSTYTGCHKQGGPTSSGPYTGLGELIDRGSPKKASALPPQQPCVTAADDELLQTAPTSYRLLLTPEPAAPQAFPRLLGRTRRPTSNTADQEGFVDAAKPQGTKDPKTIRVILPDYSARTESQDGSSRITIRIHSPQLSSNMVV
jgi:hypothetical protein